IGGGMPVGAFGGRRDIMECIAPLGSVYQAGTLSGSPVAVAAGLASLRIPGEPGFHQPPEGTAERLGSGLPAAGVEHGRRVRAEPGFYERLEATAERLVSGLQAAAAEAGVRFRADSIGGMFGVYFADAVPASYAEVTACDKDTFNRFFHAMLEAGHYFAPSAFEAGFVSIAHTDADIDATIAAAREVFAALR